ncbi:hypothetical protein Syun_018676 [Stephania yunnanensis]|uniref:Uncharacterized protein n=1 Tax=Stephania yunnanensis TaxID=152371 RepID=A0AAP0NWL0_9MAGN
MAKRSTFVSITAYQNVSSYSMHSGLGSLYHSTCDHTLGELQPELHQCTLVGISANLASTTRIKDGIMEMVEEAPKKILSFEV